MRCEASEQQWRDDATKERYSDVFKYINISDLIIK
jgi:hypothetical protein